MQAVQHALKAREHPVKTFSPAVLRQALKQAGNILKPDEVNAVLAYVVGDRRYAELDQLYLVLTCDNLVHQLRCRPNPPVQQSSTQPQLVLWRDEQSRRLYNLMADSEHLQVVDSHGWRQIAG